MGKKCKCPPAGAPDWMVSYGDMMSLLLTFFILLAALSELKKEDEFKSIMQEVRASLGSKGGGGRKDNTEDPALTLQKILEELQRRDYKEINRANTEEQGVHGSKPQVTSIRENDLLVIGGRITFEPGSADLTDEAKERLVQVAAQVRGWNNKLEIRGHAAPMELTGQAAFTDVWSLGYARARVVMQYLSSPDARLSIRPERFRVTSCGDQEPVLRREYDVMPNQPNRRVEIVVSRVLVQDVQKPEPPQ